MANQIGYHQSSRIKLNLKDTFMKVSSLLGATVLALVAGQAAAQYTGPSQNPAITDVARASKAADKSQVSLEGHLTSKVRDEHYTFEDQTGSIEVEIDHKRFPATPVSEKTRVRLQGEVDKDFGSNATIDVKQVTVLQ
ncbi:NirD/YgiW/YdeI family stress tolerance protein [Herbaspirillum sp. alder98]|uniref:NirD/YgiW/YdeI family stress tolerance protein n=1 Tax=Herbaspirillum sp. alder98 TaxID=2913096 RepID=UPI001CD8E2F5|nr:NirD/YgiW/YdeI family stress tolerance protein [Herbaspirillum sp. alder98]MCA1323110.1 NirD/YgiW/YdeI family stress tolerance protein [Herbaspirillum sp. alder98]